MQAFPRRQRSDLQSPVLSAGENLDAGSKCNLRTVLDLQLGSGGNFICEETSMLHYSVYSIGDCMGGPFATLS